MLGHDDPGADRSSLIDERQRTKISADAIDNGISNDALQHVQRDDLAANGHARARPTGAERVTVDKKGEQR